MKYFVIYYINFTNFKVKLENSYSSQEEANENLLSTSLNFIKEEQGKQQADIALQNDKSEADLLSGNFREGMYIKSNISSEKITDFTVNVYNKIKEIVSGTFYNSWEMKLNKIGMFGVSEVELNIPSPLPPVLPSGIIKPAIPIRRVNVNNCYIDELKAKLKNENFGLKHIEKMIEDVVEIDDEVEEEKFENPSKILSDLISVYNYD